RAELLDLRRRDRRDDRGAVGTDRRCGGGQRGAVLRHQHDGRRSRAGADDGRPGARARARPPRGVRPQPAPGALADGRPGGRGGGKAGGPGVAADVRSTVGAGDVLMGVLLARLSLADFDPPALAAALPEAVAEAARATERWGAVE